MKYQQSDGQGQMGVAIVHEGISRLDQIFREQAQNDVGIDAHVEFVTPEKEATGQLVGIQIKAGPSFFEEKDEQGFIFRGSEKHREYWLSHCLPIFLVLVNTENRKSYWQIINQETVESTGKGWKVTVPFDHVLETGFLASVSHAAGLTATSSSYTVLSLKDTSNTTVKRYSAFILLRPPYNRMRTEAIARVATVYVKKQRYLSNPASKPALLDVDAAVVSLYFALDPSDVESTNWYARTQWIDAKLSQDNRPLSIGGMNLGDGLEISWAKNYDSDAGFYRSLVVEKGEFLAGVFHFLAETEHIISRVYGDRGATPDEGLRQSDLASIAGNMRQLYLRSGQIGIPPLDCAGVGERFADVMALADNVLVLVNKDYQDDQAKSMNAYVLEKTLAEYRKNVGHLKYEVEKVR